MTIEELIGKNILVHCNTEEKAKQFCKECEKHNITWFADEDTYFRVYRENTYYRIDKNKVLHYGSVLKCMANDKIISFETFCTNENNFIDVRIAELEKTLADKQAIFKTMTNEINSIGFELNALALILDMRDCKTQIAELKMIKGQMQNEK